MLPDYFGEDVAATYDEDLNERFTPEHVALEAGFLADLAREGGSTGRAGVRDRHRPGRAATASATCSWRDRPVRCDGAAAARQAGGADLPVTIGDYTSTRVAGLFDVVYLVFNTIGNVTTQDAQVATFQNAAAHLRLGGCFVVETGVPGIGGATGPRYRVFHHGDDHHGIDEYDPVTQAMWSRHYIRTSDGTFRRTHTVLPRLAGRLGLDGPNCGMTLRERWACGSFFTAISPSHVSVWEKTQPGEG